MSTMLRSAINRRKQYIIQQLISSGMYQSHYSCLNDWTLSDLEHELKFIKKN